MSVNKKIFSITFDKETRKSISGWGMISQLDSQANARIGRGKWYATRYFSREEADGSLTFSVEVEVVETS